MSSIEQELFEEIIYAAFLIPALLGLALVWFFVYYLRKKHKSELERRDLLLKQQSLLIEKQRAIEYERNRIAAEMHDDLGAGLTRIRYLSERALRKAESAEETDQIRHISEQSNQLVTNMSEIIWAMNSRFDTAESLIGYIRRYASEYLEEHGVTLTFQIVDNPEAHAVSAEKRRNIFLVIKEILHNTIKYSGAHSIEITVTSDASSLHIQVVEKHAQGFDPVLAKEKGNGLFNMEKRMHAIGGHISFRRNADDMAIVLHVPFESNNQAS